MAQYRVSPDTWVIYRDSIELIPLLALDINGAPTTNYTVACVPINTHPTAWNAPDAAGAALGYLANGPALGVGSYLIYAKIVGSPETPVRIATILHVWS